MVGFHFSHDTKPALDDSHSHPSGSPVTEERDVLPILDRIRWNSYRAPHSFVLVLDLHRSGSTNWDNLPNPNKRRYEWERNVLVLDIHRCARIEPLLVGFRWVSIRYRTDCEHHLSSFDLETIIEASSFVHIHSPATTPSPSPLCLHRNTAVYGVGSHSAIKFLLHFQFVRLILVLYPNGADAVFVCVVSPLSGHISPCHPRCGNRDGGGTFRLFFIRTGSIHPSSEVVSFAVSDNFRMASR